SRGFAGAMKPDGPLEGFQADPAAPGPQHKTEAIAAGVREHDRKVGFELTVEGADLDRGVGGRRHPDTHVAVVGVERVLAPVLDHAVIDHVTVDGSGRHAGRRNAFHGDTAVHRIHRDVTVGVLQPDVLVHRAEGDPSLGVGQRHVTFDRLERDIAVTAAHVDIAVHGLDVDPRLHPFDGDVVVDPGNIQLGLGWHRDLVLHVPRWAVARFALHRQQGAEIADVEPAA